MISDVLPEMDCLVPAGQSIFDVDIEIAIVLGRVV